MVATDGEESTLTRAREIGVVASGVTSSDKGKGLHYAKLLWGDDAAEILDKNDGLFFDLIVVSEAMYYSTPLGKLVLTISQMLRKSAATTARVFSGTSDDNTDGPAAPALCLLTHFYRREDLPAGFAAAAASSGLSAVDLALPAGETDNCRAVVLCWAEDEAVLFGNPRPWVQEPDRRPTPCSSFARAPLSPISAGCLPDAIRLVALPLSSRIAQEDEVSECRHRHQLLASCGL